MSPHPRTDPRREARRELGAFLAARRAEVAPEDARLPRGLGARRVPGLRREEVALLAGISVEYYAKLERGQAGDVSGAVLDGLAAALRLDPVQAQHLATLARTVSGSHPEVVGTTVGQEVRPELLAVLRLLEPAVAFVRNARLDVLAANTPARRVYAPLFDGADAGRAPNLARYLFLDPRSLESYVDWEDLADHAVGSLRAELARSPQDVELRGLVAELVRGSEGFRGRWDGQVVRRYRAGRQTFRVPGAGELDLAYEALDVVADPGLTLLVYHAEPGSPSERLLADLGSQTAEVSGGGVPPRRG